MKEETYHIDDLDGAVTLFKSTDEGTETIAVFDEEHREVIQDLLAEVRRLSEAIADIANNMEAVDEHYKTDASYAELAKMSGFIEDLRKVIE